MNTSVIKNVKFATIVNIVFVVTSLIYVLLSLAYFIAMGNTMINGNEYEMLGFIFGLIGLPVVIVYMIIQIFRIITLICNVKLSKKIKTGEKTKGLRVSTGVMQIIDAVASFAVVNFTTTVGIMFLADSLHAVFGDGRLYSTVYCLILFTFGIISAVKGIMQIVSAVLLFKIKDNE